MQAIQLNPSHVWKAAPQHKILVIDGGAVRFDFPRDWVVLPRARHVCLFDQLPSYRCALAISWRHVPPETAALSVGYLMNQTYSAELRPILHRGEVIRYFNIPLEAAWIQLRVMDLEERREALTRMCIARAGCTQALILFDFWPEDELKLFDAWETVLRTLVVGDYIEDPTTGHRREKRG